MKRIYLTSTFIIIACTSIISAQEKAAADDAKSLTDKAFAAFQQGKIDQAIELASKVVALEKKSGNTSSHVTAILNLARLRRDKLVLLRNKAANKNLTVSERVDLSIKAAENAEEAERLYRQALELNEAGGRARTEQTADFKSELAWLTYNYFPTDGTPSIPEARARIDHAESLFAESLSLNEDIRGRDADETLLVVLAYGNFYLKYDNFEKALPFYERYIHTVKTKRGPKHPDLVNALRPYAQILYATFQEQESGEAVRTIEEITGQKETLPMGRLDLQLRSKDAVAFHANAAAMARNKARLNIGGRQERPVYVPVKVVVDDSGKVIEAAAETENSDLRKRAEQKILTWTVRPFLYNGVTRKLRGYLRYHAAS